MSDKQSHHPIAVVGIGCVFPAALTPETFWQNVVNAVDCCRPVPKSRWIASPETMYDSTPRADKAYSVKACFVDDFEPDLEGLTFDPEFVRSLDPLFSMVLHAGNTAFSDCVNKPIDRGRIGSILAAIALPTQGASRITRHVLGTKIESSLWPEKKRQGDFYRKPISRMDVLNARVTSLPASLLSTALELGGTCLTLDAACASSLYAVALACDELRSGRADAMLAGGVSRPESLYTQVGFSQLKALSPSGRCAPFDKSADGLVVGEGAGIVVLKRLEDAVAHEDRIYGVIHSIGMSNDIEGNLLAPSSEGQVRAMRQAYAACGWSPADIELIECHGAGTPVGDAVEVNSLMALRQSCSENERPCAIGSVKSMIGHLLTAAGAAGLIKTLLSLYHKTLPPSLNFQALPEQSPLHHSPFRVQTSAEPWKVSSSKKARRAAVSAFGFGGINAHLLLEEFAPKNSVTLSGVPAITKKRPKKTPTAPLKTFGSSDPVAIVGMAAHLGSLNGLRHFQEAVLRGDDTIRQRPVNRWKNCDDESLAFIGNHSLPGGYIDNISISLGEFRIPPNEIPEILPQQLLMLKVAAGAMKDAGLAGRENRPDMGTIIGIAFDFEATNFHLRWSIHPAVEQWEKHCALRIKTDSRTKWLESLQRASSPPLNATRTLGALGGIVASRVAREFRFGGPSFVVSAEEASGVKALEIATRALTEGQLSSVLVGAVDLAGDIRQVAINHRTAPFSKSGVIRPFDHRADGSLPGEGACALVLKRLDDALLSGDRIYSVIHSIGSASGSMSGDKSSRKNTYLRSLERAFENSGTAPAKVRYFETHGSGVPEEDRIEADAISTFFSAYDNPVALGSTKPVIGNTGASAGLASVIKTALCLYQKILPPIKNFTRSLPGILNHKPIHIPVEPSYWARNRIDGPRVGCTAALTSDGNAAHVILSEPETGSDNNCGSGPTAGEQKRPLGFSEYGLFVVEGNSRNEIYQELSDLKSHISKESPLSVPLEHTAKTWFARRPLDLKKNLAMCMVSSSHLQMEKLVEKALHSELTETDKPLNGDGHVYFSPSPMGQSGELAFVFPGSGNHYVTMGRTIGLVWPEILREMDDATQKFESQMLPQYYTPWRDNWESDWESDAHAKIVSDPLNMIFGQVVHGALMTRVFAKFGISPSASIGYSLGESAAFFALGAWPDRGQMLNRMHETDLFSQQLAGPCLAARRAWQIPSDEPFDWCVAVVNRPRRNVKETIKKWQQVRLLIVNTPEECVIGGQKKQVESVIKALGCEAVFLDGVVTVHCDAAEPVRDAYRSLHHFPTTPPEGIRFYSCAWAKSFELTSDNAADAIVHQALYGFDFPKVIQNAYEDGVRIFVEMGPHASCTRMIRSTLKDRSHVSVSGCVRGENDFLTLLKCLGVLISERVPVDLAYLYGKDSFPMDTHTHAMAIDSKPVVTVPVGEPIGPFALPCEEPEINIQESENHLSVEKNKFDVNETLPMHKEEAGTVSSAFSVFSEVISTMTQNLEADAKAHQSFLDLTQEMSKTYGKAFNLQNRLLETLISETGASGNDFRIADAQKSDITTVGSESPGTVPAFSRDLCMEFAIGSAARVLGPEFTEVDTYRARVRLPDEPLMLVDRILSIEGEKGAMGSGRIVTEHDVFSDAWYLDGGKAPVCISVEAGQADLFLCSYLGIDLRVKGKRTYRLLDAQVEFHRSLPDPGDTIRYEIEIEKFVRQSDTYLFFFHFEGYIGDDHLITMTDGCAGFFTEEEVRNSGGILPEKQDIQGISEKSIDLWLPPVPPGEKPESLNEEQIKALRNGDLLKGFGPGFEGITIAPSLRLPGGRMTLIHRIVHLDLKGGPFGLGLIKAEADIHPDDWFLTCHFMDDMVMPGTLMYECCAHTLRVMLQRMGWVTDKTDAYYEPVVGVKSLLKCRGPVTPQTRHVIYEVALKQIGYDPEPYVIADALMYADGHRIVVFRDMSMKISNISRADIEAAWNYRPPLIPENQPDESEALFNRDKILAFAIGKPSEAFGEPYRIFDKSRVIARLPGPPYAFMDSVMHIEPAPWELKPDGWIESEYRVPVDEWYLRANRTRSVPFCVVLEIALQPCGWLAAYCGSALKSEKDLRFRNLGGRAVMKENILSDPSPLKVRCRMSKVAEAVDMIIEHFDFQVLREGKILYEGNTYFGFFTKEALANQVGIHEPGFEPFEPDAEELTRGFSVDLPVEAPIFPEDSNRVEASALSLPARALNMIDRIEVFIPDGGPQGLGFIRGIKTVDPEEWFFKAHFFQDPVCPGSLGIESFLQLLKFAAIHRWPGLSKTHDFGMLNGLSHAWIYRGQVIPRNKVVTVDAIVTHVEETPTPTIRGDGVLKVDGLCIYKMENFGITLVLV